MKNLMLLAFLSLALFVVPAYAAEAAPAAEKKAEAAEKKADTAEKQPTEEKADGAEAKPAHADVKAATGIEKREPTGEADKFEAGTTIYVWSRVFDADGEDVEHVWKRDDKEFRRAKFHIGSVRWTVNSRQRNAKKGSYVVEVVRGEDKLGEVSFTVE